MKSWKYFLIGTAIQLSSVASAGTDKALDSEDVSAFASPQAFFSYFDFRFNSTSGQNYSRYQGHSKLYGLAGNAGIIKDQPYFLGAGIYRVETDINTQTELSPFPQRTSAQSIKNNTLYGYGGKQFKPWLYAGLLGGYGQSKINATYFLAPNTTNFDSAYARHDSHNWFLSANGIAHKTYKQFQFRGHLGVLYSEVNSDAFAIPFTVPANIPKFNNKTTWVMENLRVTAKHHPNVQPFLDGGLFQVTHSKDNLPGITAPINGSLPQLNANKSGYRVGGGVRLLKSPLTLDLRYQYYKAGQVYHNNIFNATLGLVSDKL